MGVPHYYIQCMVSYASKSRHKCVNDNSCDRCRCPMDKHRPSLAVTTRCEVCLRVFSDAECFTLHKTLLCKKSWCCPKCQFSYPQKHPKEGHQCYESKCVTCGEYAVKTKHLCFIQPERAKPGIPDGKIRVFDFESDITGTHHIPNYAAVSDEKEGLTCYENDGDSIMDEFMVHEILTPSINIQRLLRTTPRDTMLNSYAKSWTNVKSSTLALILEGRSCYLKLSICVFVSSIHFRLFRNRWSSSPKCLVFGTL